MATTDFMFPNMPRLKNDIFKVSFLLTYFLFTIKYYYGPDIDTYVPHYEENIKTISYVFANLSNMSFEPGYNIFCSISKSLGLSFWAMTAVVSTIYFSAIYQLFKQLKTAKTFALMILVVMDNGIMYAAIRQCLAVSMFIFMILALQKKNYINTLLFLILSISFHKSAIFAITIVLIAAFIQNSTLKKYSFEVLLTLLCILTIVPLINLIEPIIYFLPLSWDTLKSIEHHLLLGRSIQVVFLVYFVTLICINYFTINKTSKNNIIKTSVVAGFILIVLFYQYFYVLNRMRSYFLPIIILYTINLSLQYFENKQYKIPFATCVRQLAILFMFTYVIFQTHTLENSYKKNKSQIHDCTTIFELKYSDKETIKQRQLKKAKIYWKEDFMDGSQNRLDKKND